MRGFVAGLVALLVLVMAPGAQAVQRFAAPTGSGTECLQAKPCLLAEAVMGAKPGDEVIVTGGTYPLVSGIFTPPSPNIQIHGETGGPMPRISASFPGFALGLTEPGDSLSYVEIENDATNGQAVYCSGARIERVRVRAVGIGASGATVYSDCAIRNSLFRVEGLSSTALRGVAFSAGTTSASARNVTAIASGSGSTGVTAEYNEGSPGSFTMELENSIVQGGETDLKPMAGPKGPGNIAAIHSNFDTSSPVGEAKVIDGGGNQTAPPLFVNAETGDYSEAPGSPTIDAGVAGELGPLDLAGNARVLGSAPDIGAFEFVPPVVAQIQSLAVNPNAFRAGNAAGAIASRKKKAAAPLGATVSYSLSAAGSVEFSLELQTTGRKAGKKCVKKTRGNARHKKCSSFKPVKGGFSVAGVAGPNSFKFSGKLGGKALKPGSYRLIGSAGGAVESANFKIVG
jgi:hypothetical protein